MCSISIFIYGKMRFTVYTVPLSFKRHSDIRKFYTKMKRIVVSALMQMSTINSIETWITTDKYCILLKNCLDMVIMVNSKKKMGCNIILNYFYMRKPSAS